MNEYFTWAFLATFAGATTATGILTQLLKVIRLPTQVLSYIIALLIVVVSAAAVGTATEWTDWAILPLNAVLVSLASNGAYSAILRLKGGDDNDN